MAFSYGEINKACGTRTVTGFYAPPDNLGDTGKTKRAELTDVIETWDERYGVPAIQILLSHAQVPVWGECLEKLGFKNIITWANPHHLGRPLHMFLRCKELTEEEWSKWDARE